MSEQKSQQSEQKEAGCFDSNLLKEVTTSNKKSMNVVISPFSVLNAMTMCLLGADNNTLKQMMSVLYPSKAGNEALSFENSAKLTADIVAICKYYTATYQGESENALIRIANKLWIEKAYKISDDYVKATKTDAVSEFDGSAPDQTAKKINLWCSEITKEMITKLVTSEMLQNAALVITNAIYFDAKFENPFKQRDTRKDVSFFSDRSKETEVCKVEMMFSRSFQIHALKVNGVYDVVKLPYKSDKKLSLIVAINDSDNNEVPLFSTQDIRKLDASKTWQDDKIELFLPKFKFEYEADLKEVLTTMGVTDAFDSETADFSNMSKQSVYISKVIHKAVIEVDENGTKAAAATAVAMAFGSGKPRKLEKVRFDHPFQFFIFDEEKGEALFAGIFCGN